MKKSIYILICLFTLVIGSVLPVNAQQAFYIYRNDGAINAFITTEIDSMSYSYMDVDSVIHDEIVVHEIHTPDSIFRIPIEVIDSVGFVTPKTVYQPGVKMLEGDMRNYIVSRDGLTLIFQLSTPSMYLPRMGDRLVTLDVDDIITNAFVGKVSEINTRQDCIEVVCEPVDLTDIFDTYYGVIRKVDEPASVKKRSITDGVYSTNGTNTYSPGKLSLDLLNTHHFQVEYKVDKELSFSLDHAQATISFTPTIDYNAFLIVNKDYGTYISVTAIGNYTLDEYLALAGSMTVKNEISLIKKAKPIPEALIDVFFEFGIFANLKATLSTEQTWTQKYRHVFHWEWSSKGHETLKKTNDFKPISNSHTGTIALNGTLNIGAYAKVGIAFIATSSLDIAEIDLRADGGLSIEGTYVPYKRDEEYAKKSTDLYNQIKEREVGVYLYYGLSAEATLFKWSINKQIPNFSNLPLNKKGKINGFRLVPLFSDTKLTRDNSGTYYATTNVLGNVFTTDVGFALINQQDKEDATYSYSLYGYNGPANKAEIYFPNKSVINEYAVYPLVKYMGMELIAEPSAIMDMCPANITKVECISAGYYKDYVSPYWMTFDVTAYLDDTQDIEEWGVYFLSDSDNEYINYPFENISSTQTIRFITMDDGSNMRINYSSFVAELDDRLGVYVRKRKDDGQLKTIYGDLSNVTLRYDTKPSLTMSNPHIKNTDIINDTIITDEYGNSKVIYQYKTTCSYTETVQGAFWIDYVDYGVSGENWSLTDNSPWYPTVDTEYTGTWSSTYWGNTENLNHSNWEIIHLRNSTKTINSNYLNWSGDGTITNVWCSSSAAYAPKRISSQTYSNASSARENYVEDFVSDANEKEPRNHLPTPKVLIPYNGGFIGTY